MVDLPSLEHKTTVDERLMLLDRDIRRFRIDFERFFSGNLPIPPEQRRITIINQIKDLRTERMRAVAHRFRFNSLEAKFNALLVLFNRRLREFELGRKDTQTLVRACGVNAGGREAAMLEQLETLGKQLDAKGCQYWLLRVRLLRKIPGRAAEAKAACNEAAVGPCDNPRDRPLWEKTCR